MKLKSEIPTAADPLERPKRKDFVKVKQLKKKKKLSLICIIL